MEVTSDFKELTMQYEQQGLLSHITRKVSADSEMMAVMKKTKGQIPLLFHQVDGYPCKVVTGLGGSRKLLAQSMGITEDKLRKHLAAAIAHPIPVTHVAEGKCQQEVHMAPFSLVDYFPVLRHYEKDNGKFIISGMMVAKSIDGSKYYTSIRRMWYKGKNQMTVLITSREMQEQFAYYEARKEPMEIAVMFGLVPAVVLGSQISTHLYNADKLEVSGALLSKSLETVKCKTIDLEVLSDAQVVLEGKVYPWKKEKEGPFGEMAYYYGEVKELPLCEFSCITMQKNPLWHTFFPSGCEEKLPMAISREVNLFNTIQMTVPGVRNVHLTMGGAGRYHAVVQIKKEQEGDGKQAALSAFASDKDLKYVTVVDEDVDIFDAEEVEWAITTRTQAASDIFIIPAALGSPLEASHHLKNTTDKMGIDATKPIGDKRFERTHVIGEEKIDLKEYIEERRDSRWHLEL